MAHKTISLEEAIESIPVKVGSFEFETQGLNRTRHSAFSKLEKKLEGLDDSDPDAQVKVLGEQLDLILKKHGKQSTNGKKPSEIISEQWAADTLEIDRLGRFVVQLFGELNPL